MKPRIEPTALGPDSKPLSTEALLSALHAKFSANFEASRPSLSLAPSAEVERSARMLSGASNCLERLAGESPHQRALAACLDEIFGDSVCALYLACCGLNVPARMLLRRSLELGLVVAAYWDSPVDFWNWRDHDADIRFTALCSYLQSAGYKSVIAHQPIPSKIDSSSTLQGLEGLYAELSNVVHPKTYNFSTAGAGAYDFNSADMAKTLSYASKVHSALASILAARFAELEVVFFPAPKPTR